MKNKKWILLIILAFVVFGAAAQYKVNKTTLVYKVIDGSELEMTVYQPQIQSDVQLPAIVFYFGGGWVSGNPDHFSMQAEYLASRGIVAICPDYRTKNNAGTTPFESVKDAKSAMRYIKNNAGELRIDSSKIIAAGGSAGGHLAACTATIKNINDENDDISVSTMPMALVLFNPVVDTSKKGYGQEKVAGREFEISPVHHITANIPPTLIMHGKDDTTVPYENVVRFKHLMRQVGNQCTLIGYKKQKHGFFNFAKKPKHFKKTLKKTEYFLDDKGLLRGETWLRKYYRELKKKS